MTMTTLNVNGQLREVDADASTPLLMHAFYRQRADTPGMTKAEALRQAQLSLLHGTASATPGTAALLEHNPNPTAAETRDYMSLNLCRCGTHMRILRAIERASRLMQAAKAQASGGRI